nr:DUF72 domain-containing protein [Rufibacter sp. LB8]
MARIGCRHHRHRVPAPARPQLYRGSYPEEELERLGYMAQDFLLDGKTVWAFFNNTIGGNATQDAQKLRQVIMNL